MLKNVRLLVWSLPFCLALSSFPVVADDWCSPCCANCYASSGCFDPFWADAEYLYWQIKDSPVPVPLVQTDTETVLGASNVNTNWRSGGRFSIGYWFDPCEACGLEASYFFLAKNSKTQSVSSSGLPGSTDLLLPFFNAVDNEESNVNISYSGGSNAFSGLARLKISNSTQGAELNVVTSIPFYCNWNVGALIGFRYWNFDEHLTFFTDSPYINVDDVFQTTDKFKARNNFYGGQIGLGFQYTYDCFFLDFKGKVALGAVFENAIIDGSFSTNDFTDYTTVQTFEGGYFAQSTNIGNHRKTKFSVLPEVNVDIGYQLQNWMRVKVGYTFLYVSQMLWAGKEIDRNINPTQSAAIAYTPDAALVGVALPKALFKSGSFWAQGVSVGVDFRF